MSDSLLRDASLVGVVNAPIITGYTVWYEGFLMAYLGSTAKTRSLAYRKLGQYERAIEDLDEDIRLDPQNADAYHNRAVAYQNLGKQELAERDFAKAKELKDE